MLQAPAIHSSIISEEVNSVVYASALTDKYQFIRGGHLDMKLILERFVKTFADLYEDESEKSGEALNIMQKENSRR